MMIRSFLLGAALTLSASASFAANRPGGQRVAIDTDAGAIVVELDTKHAPITTGNFLGYADKHLFDGTYFYRAARTKGAPTLGFVQGGVRHSATRSLPPIAHEPTSKTGIHHVDGTISMARNEPGTAMGDFFITVGPAPGMDAHPGKPGDNLGFAAFGHVVKGMDIVHRILAAKTVDNAGAGLMRGQLLAAPVKIISVKRIG
jgi:peptidyl-prolyl cis-trans isomerase A (cyclophilin A)